MPSTPEARRYNRRTRAIEELSWATHQQAVAMERMGSEMSRIADALTVSALADAARSEASQTTGVSRHWTPEAASELLNATIAAARKVAP